METGLSSTISSVDGELKVVEERMVWRFTFRGLWPPIPSTAKSSKESRREKKMKGAGTVEVMVGKKGGRE